MENELVKNVKYPIISEDASYTFSDYFKLNFDIEDILAYFGYSFQVQNILLPQAPLEAKIITDLKTRLEKSLFHLRLTSEVARREFLIAPILLEVVFYTQAKLKIEYPLNVNEQLKGTLDYYLQAKNNILIVEAKNGDLERGFTQLAIELVALNKWSDHEAKQLHGAVSMGNIWQFGILDRQTRQVVQDLNLYRVPADLEDLLKSLVAILTNSTHPQNP